jgi:hypothetical protein
VSVGIQVGVSGRCITLVEKDIRERKRDGGIGKPLPMFDIAGHFHASKKKRTREWCLKKC